MGDEQPALVGVKGTEYLLQALGTSTDPRRTINDFQRQQGLKDMCDVSLVNIFLNLTPCLQPSCVPILELLDLHGVARRDIHTGLLDTFRAQFMEGVSKLPVADLTKLLEMVFPYIAQPGLRDAVMAVLAAHPSLPTAYLRALRGVPAVLSACPLRVRRQVWRLDRALFAAYSDDLLRGICPTTRRSTCTSGRSPQHAASAAARCWSWRRP